jgi:hypothetical protein
VIDFGKLTEQETEELLKQCISYLRWEVLSGVLTVALTEEQKEDLGEVWFGDRLESPGAR